MFRHWWSAGYVAEIEISVHITWFFMMGIITVSLALGYFPWRYPDFDPLCQWCLGIAGMCLLFLTLLAHELGHVRVARIHGLGVEGIRLFLFGGMAVLRREPLTPGDEFRLACSGPLCSLCIAMFLTILYSALSMICPNSPIVALVEYLAIANYGLGLFNLLPVLPSDGGYIAHALLWYWTVDHAKATQHATFLAELVTKMIVLLGLYRMIMLVLVPGQPVVLWFSAVWMVLMGWFLSKGPSIMVAAIGQKLPRLDADKQE
jgi:Zn-dependent protease